MITAIPTTPRGVPLLTLAQLDLLNRCNEAETVLHAALKEAEQYGTSELPWHINDRIIEARKTLRTLGAEPR